MNARQRREVTDLLFLIVALSAFPGVAIAVGATTRTLVVTVVCVVCANALLAGITYAAIVDPMPSLDEDPGPPVDLEHSARAPHEAYAFLEPGRRLRLGHTWITVASLQFSVSSAGHLRCLATTTDGRCPWIPVENTEQPAWFTHLVRAARSHPGLAPHLREGATL